MAIIVALLGLSVGSFLNVLIGKLRSGERGSRKRSRCPKCHIVLRPSELIPVVSFFVLRRKCRGCERSISWQYPLVELALMAALLVSYWVHGGAGAVFGPEWLFFVRDAVFVSALVVVFVIDYQDMIVFDSVTLPMIVIAGAFNLFLGVSFLNLLLAVLVGGGFFLFQYVISKGKWIGGGDIRIGAMVGAMVGFPGVVAVLLISYVMGAFFALSLIGLKKTTWKSQLAFGTFLTVATVIVLFFGDQIWNWYGSLIF